MLSSQNGQSQGVSVLDRLHFREYKARNLEHPVKQAGVLTMSMVRRDFVKIGAAGFAGLVLPQASFGQKSEPASGKRGTADLETGATTITLAAELRTGSIRLHAQRFEAGKDRAMVSRGNFQPTNGEKIELYRAYFRANGGRQVLARLDDNDHSTALVLSNSEDANLYHLTVWNDAKAPQTFRVDSRELRETQRVPGELAAALAGQRKPPDITLEDMENAFASDPDYIAFTRGKTLPHQHAKIVDFACFLVLLRVPGGAAYSFWEP